MNNKEIVADAIKEISKEKQEAEIKKIKDIVKSYLEKISNKKEKVKEVQEELRALEKDLDDLKAGRLDKIEERQGKDPVHDRVTIIEIHRIEKEYIPYQPWRSQYEIVYVPYPPVYYNGYSTTIGQTGISYCSNTTSISNQLQGIQCGGVSSVSSSQSQIGNCQTQASGIQFQNFVQGQYWINGQSINL